MKNIALIGCGYWGKNYINTFRDIDGAKLGHICDINEANLKKYSSKLSDVFFYNNYKDITLTRINGVIIATNATSHFEIAKYFLEKNVGVFIEKPLTTKTDEAEELVKLAEYKKCPLMVGHIFEFNSPLNKVKDLVSKGEIGELRYLESTRKGLGPIRKDVSALWDLASHDIYISTSLTGQLPSKISCNGVSHNGSIDDIVSVNLFFDKDIISTIYANWEHPIKERKLYVGGTKKAILFDDVEPVNKVVIYDKGITYQPVGDSFTDFSTSIRDGDIIIPKVNGNNPLKDEIEHFLAYLDSGKCIAPGSEGLKNVRILEAAELSRKNNGVGVDIKW